MSDFLLTIGAKGICPHAGQLTISPGDSKVKLMGQPVATQGDLGKIAGCPFNIIVPIPCIKVMWLQTATKVRIGGKFALLQNGAALCTNPAQAPQGPLTVVANQLKVRGM